MPFVKLNWQPNRKELRQFGAVFLGGFVFIGLVKYLWPFERFITRDQTLGFWLIAIGLIVGAIGLTGTRLALPFYWAWLGIAFVMGNIMSRLIIALIYYLIITPMGLLSRLVGRDPLQLKKPKGESYWRDLQFPKDNEAFERQF